MEKIEVRKAIKLYKIVCVVPTKDRKEILKDVIIDLLQQTVTEFLLVVVNSGKDITDVIKTINDKRLLCINKKDISIGEMYNIGLNYDAEYFFAANDDDFYSHDRFEKQLSILKDNVCTCLKTIPYVFENGNVYIHETISKKMNHGSTFACDMKLLKYIKGWTSSTSLDKELWYRWTKNNGIFYYTEEALNYSNYFRRFLCLQHKNNLWKRKAGNEWKYYCRLTEYISTDIQRWNNIPIIQKYLKECE